MNCFIWIKVKGLCLKCFWKLKKKYLNTLLVILISKKDKIKFKKLFKSPQFVWGYFMPWELCSFWHMVMISSIAIWLIDGTLSKVDLGEWQWRITPYSLEPHHQLQFSIIPGTLLFDSVPLLCRGHNLFILSTFNRSISFLYIEIWVFQLF